MISYGQILKWQCPRLHSKDYDIIETMVKDIKKYRCRTSITSIIFQPIDIHDILFKPVVFKTGSSLYSSFNKTIIEKTMQYQDRPIF